MAELVTEAVVLRTFPSGESDLVVSLYSSTQGKIRAVAKGAKRSKKRFMNCLDDFGLVRVVLDVKPGREVMRIDACQLLDRPDFSGNCLLFGLGGLALELVWIFCPDQEPDDEIYAALKTTLLGLAQAPDPAGLGLAFALRLLHAAGFGPNFEACLICGKPLDRIKKGAFDLRAGGLVCLDCQPN
ncbi:MAG: DNA repair protein RecO, partial [Deltaproteobacteria bacterium]|nr:DNA repair protein RecO [Deltaproteobacteria bacterium]